MTAFNKAWNVVKGKTGDPAEDGCSKCGVKGDDVHECWNCDKHLCIDCDPGEMRSDFDGHTYCDKCGPDGAKVVKYDTEHECPYDGTVEGDLQDRVPCSPNLRCRKCFEDWYFGDKSYKRD